MWASHLWGEGNPFLGRTPLYVFLAVGGGGMLAVEESETQGEDGDVSGRWEAEKGPQGGQKGPLRGQQGSAMLDRPLP